MKLILISIVQSLLLCGGQVLLKFALRDMGPFHWSMQFFVRQLSMAYPMISLSYVFGMFAAILFFQEQVPLTRWLGVLLIICGCFLVAK